MSNLTDFFPSGGGGLTPKFEEFNASGTFTPTQALIDAGGYIEVFLVGGGAGGGSASGGQVLQKKVYLTSITPSNITIGAGGNNAVGGNSICALSSSGGIDITAPGGAKNTLSINNSTSPNNPGVGLESLPAGQGIWGYGIGAIGGSDDARGGGVWSALANTGQGGRSGIGASGYCLIKWYE
jgi:hypothetical protein